MTQPPTPARTSRLKRRAGTAQTNSLFPDLDEEGAADVEEPPHKRFKALFDASDPDRLFAQSQLPESALELSETSGNPFLTAGSYVPRSDSSQTQTQPSIPGAPLPTTTRPALTAVREEEEESGPSYPESQALVGGRSRKRGRGGEDAEMEDDENVRPVGPSKRQAVEHINAIGSTPEVPTSETPAPAPAHTATATQKKAAGAMPGKPDTDAEFLKAVASRKRGKKTEDEFDREFNNLRISKPDLAVDAREHEYTVLADFGDDTSLRGNFMTVLEMDVFKRDGPMPGRLRGAERAEWEGRQNFKKFRKVRVTRTLTIILRG